MTIALDVGASSLRTLCRDGGQLACRTVPMAYAVLEDTPAHRRLLDDAGIRFLLTDDRILLVGRAAITSAGLFQVPLRPLLPSGRLPQGDPVARQIISCLMETVLPAAAVSDVICVMSLPPGMNRDAVSSAADVSFFQRLVQLQNYCPHIVPASQALVLAELGGTAFSGIGLVLGASGGDALLARHGQLLCRVTTGTGGDWLDSTLWRRGLLSQQQCPSDEAGTVRQTNSLSVRAWRESAGTSDPDFESSVMPLLESVCRDLISTFETQLQAFGLEHELARPLPVICGGGLSLSQGFEPIIVRVLDESRLPFDRSQLRMADMTSRPVLRGLLAAAELEAESRPGRSVA